MHNDNANDTERATRLVQAAAEPVAKPAKNDEPSLLTAKFSKARDQQHAVTFLRRLARAKAKPKAG